MLQSIREMAKSWIVKTFLMLLLASFAVWGIGDMFRGNQGQKEVASVGKVSIPLQVLQQRFQSSLPQMRQTFGANLTSQEAIKIGLMERMLNVMLEEISFTQETARLGLNVSDDIILKQIAEAPGLAGPDGKFSKDRWNQALRRLGVSERTFVNNEREQMARNIIFSSVLSNVKPPKIMIDTLYQARGAKRILDVVALDHKSIRSVGKADTEVLKAFYEEYKSDFIAPEYRGITIAKLTTASVEGDINVSEEEVKKAYKQRAAEYTDPETRDIIQLVVQDEAKAKKLSSDAQNGGLAKAAKIAGKTPIKMKKISEQSVLPALHSSLFSLAESGVSSPVKSSLGWHVMEVTKINKGGLRPYSEVKKELNKRLQEERAGDNLARLVNQWDDELAAGQALEDIADMLKLRLTRVASVDATGKAPNGKMEKNIPSMKMILQSAFELNGGETGPVMEDGKGNYYVVRVDEVTLSQPRPFDSIKKQARAAWIKVKQSEVASKRVEDMAKAMRDGKAARKFAANRGVSVRVSKPISFLGDMDRKLPVSAMNKIFDMKKGDVITAKGEGRHYVLKLADIIDVNPKKPGSARLKVVDSVRKNLPRNYLEEYGLYLHELFPRHIDLDLIEQLKRQDAAL